MRIVADTSDLTALAGKFVAVPAAVEAAAEPVMERAAYNVRRDARALIRGQITGTYLPHYPRSITYEVEAVRAWIEAEIGPEIGRPQGGMGRGVEYGSVNTRPLPHLIPALEQEIPRMERHMDRVLRKSLP